MCDDQVVVTYVSPEETFATRMKVINLLLGADQEIKLNSWQTKSTGFLSAT